jgi:hypothetical protein
VQIRRNKQHTVCYPVRNEEMQPWNLGGGRKNEEIAVCNNQRNEEMKNKIVRTQNTQSNWRNRRGDTRVQINQTSTRTWNQKLKRQNVEKTMPMNKTRNRGQKIDEAGPAPANSEKAKSMRIQHKRERETRRKTEHTSICRTNRRRKTDEPEEQEKQRREPEICLLPHHVKCQRGSESQRARRRDVCANRVDLDGATHQKMAAGRRSQTSSFPALANHSSLPRPSVFVSVQRASKDARKPAGNSDGKL